MISESMFEGTLCIHPVWTVSPQRVGDVMAQSSSFLARGGQSFALMSWQEVRKTPGRPIVNQDFVSRTVYIHSLSAWSPNLANSAPCEGGTGGSAGSCNQQQTHLFVARQLLPAQKSSQQQNSSGTEKKFKMCPN